MASKRPITVVLLVAVMLAVLLTVFWLFVGAKPFAGPSVSHDVGRESAPHIAQRPEKPEVDARAADNSGVVAGPGATAPNEGTEDSNGFVLRLQVVDAGGLPIVGLTLRFADKRFSGWPKGWGEPAAMYETATDNAGFADVPLKKRQTIYVKSSSELWHLETSIDAKPDVVPVVVARPVATIYLSIVTDSNEPWYGQGRVTSKSDGRHTYFNVKAGELVKLERLPVDDFTFLFLESMIGVDEQTRNVPASEIKSEATLHFTLKTNPNNKNGAIEVDASAFPAEIRELRILIASSGANTWIEPAATFRTSKVWRSRPLWPQAYTVRIVGREDSDPVWTSDPVEVKPREITNVVVSMGEVCGVRVEVSDERSDPLQDALLLLGEDLLPNFDFIQPSPGSVARSDFDGRAALSGLRPGVHKFTVAAKGFEPQVLEAELAGGEVRFLGVVQLTKATGAITVKLTGMKEKQKYTIMVLKPGGTTLHSARDVKDTTTTFAGMSLNTYMVAVVAGQGGKPVTATITLSTDQPEASVTLDVAQLVESRLK